MYLFTKYCILRRTGPSRLRCLNKENDDAKRVQFAEEIEPLVQFIEETTPSEIVEGTLAQLRAACRRTAC